MDNQNNIKSFNIKRFNNSYTNKGIYIYNKYKNFETKDCGLNESNQWENTTIFLSYLAHIDKQIKENRKTFEYKPENVDKLLYEYHNTYNSYNYIEVSFPNNPYGLYENSYVSDVVSKFNKYKNFNTHHNTY